MSFGTGQLNDPQKAGAGQRMDQLQLILTAREFEDNLRIGRFAKIDSGSLDNMDGSASPLIAGVVLRDVSRPVEDTDVIDADLYDQVEYLRQGLVLVDVKSGETPSRFDRVYVSNDGDADDGLATATNTDVAVNAEFVEEWQTDVWLIYVNPASGDLTSHINDSDDAHAASAVSVEDSDGFTDNENVETVLAEMLPATPQIAVIADPGDTNAIPVTRSGNVAITTGSSGETRSLADPGSVGLTLDLTHDVDGGGDAVITAASPINQTGNNTITLADEGDYLRLESVQIGGSNVWRVVSNDGADLTTV